jgi:hypothetical protein
MATEDNQAVEWCKFLNWIKREKKAVPKTSAELEALLRQVQAHPKNRYATIKLKTAGTSMYQVYAGPGSVFRVINGARVHIWLTLRDPAQVNSIDAYVSTHQRSKVLRTKVIRIRTSVAK